MMYAKPKLNEVGMPTQCASCCPNPNPEWGCAAPLPPPEAPPAPPPGWWPVPCLPLDTC